MLLCLDSFPWIHITTTTTTTTTQTTDKQKF
jgi:hypothetical protein